MLSLGGGSSDIPPPPSNGLMSLGGGGAQKPLSSSPLPPPSSPLTDHTQSDAMETDSSSPPPVEKTDHRNEEIQADLPELEPALEGMEAIETKKILLLINNFVITTVEFMNKFGVLCERRLREVSQKTKRVEIQLNILEEKLNSVPWLSDATLESPAAADVSGLSANSTSHAPPPAAAAPGATDMPPPPPPGSPPPPQAAAAPEQAQAQPSIDPRYQNYLNMVKMGVPPAALQNKINAEGLDFGVFENLVESGVTSVGGGGGMDGDGGSAGVEDESEESGDSEEDFD